MLFAPSAARTRDNDLCSAIISDVQWKSQTEARFTTKPPFRSSSQRGQTAGTRGPIGRGTERELALPYGKLRGDAGCKKCFAKAFDGAPYGSCQELA
jgi:hypothetical protein